MATDHDGALDCTPGAGDGERAPAAAPLHCDPTSTGSLESPHYCRLFSAPARYLDMARAQLLKCCPAFSNAPRSGKLCNKAAGDSSREGWQAEAGRRVRIRIAPRLPFPSHWVLRGSIGMAFSAPPRLLQLQAAEQGALVSQPLVFPHRWNWKPGNKPSSGKTGLSVPSFFFFFSPGPGLARRRRRRVAPRRARCINYDAAYLSAAPVSCATCSSSSLVAPAMGMWMYVSGNRRGGRLLVLLFIGGSLALVLPGIGGGWL